MGKPQDLPAGKNQMHLAILLNLFTHILALVTLVGIGQAAVWALLDVAIASVVLYLALMITSRLARFEQALGAICGAGAIMNFAAMPILHLTQTPVGQAPNAIAMLSNFVLLVWSLSLIGHVIRHTFEIRMPISIVAAVMYYLFIMSVFAAVFPETGLNQGQ